MFKLSAIVLLVFSVYYIQCLPAQTSVSDTEAKSGDRLQLFVSNGTEGGTNYHLSSVISDLKSEDQNIDAELNAVLPYLNFLFDPDKGGNGLEGCFDQLDVQLVYD